MLIIDKIALILLIIGFLGCAVNAVRAAKIEDWRNHFYSSIPIGASILYGAIRIIISIINK